MIFVTPYDLQSKKCLAASNVSPFESLPSALAANVEAGPRIIRQSKRLLLLDFNGAGLAFSDYRIRYE